MEDIKFHKFVCYILNCLDTTKQYVYVDGKYYESGVDRDSKLILINYEGLNSIELTDTDWNKKFQNLKDAKIMPLIDKLAKMKPYINVQYVPDYIVNKDKKLVIKQSIYQIFNILKTSFDAKRWYIDYNFTPNKPSPQNTVQLTRQFIGGDGEYNKFLQSVIDAFILLLNKEIPTKDKLIMYVLSKINYYIAKQYVKVTIDTKDKNTTPYKNSEFDKLKVYDGTYKDDDSEYKLYYQKEILDTMNINVTKTKSIDDSCSDLFNKTDFTIVRLFNTIKPFLKKQPTVFYQTPITTYTYNPTNIRPLIYRRASEYDLSNFATQIASDAFLNKNKLPVIYDFKKIMEPVTKASATGAAVGGCSDVNNSSNVYRTIYVKILNILNAKRITLNNKDKEAIEIKLNELEQTENYLKERLGDYAKYVSATQDKDTTVDYSKVKQFLNEYEDKIKEYNINTAKIIRFIGRLTPYLY